MNVPDGGDASGPYQHEMAPVVVMPHASCVPTATRVKLVPEGLAVRKPQHATEPSFRTAHAASKPTPTSCQLFTSTHVVPFCTYPAAHAMPHVCAAQVAVPWAGAVHVVVHEPQCAGEVSRSKQPAPQTVCPAGHVLLHVPLPHTAAVQAFVQLPQWAPSLVVSTSQPSAPALLQSAKPVLQLPTSQAPARHVGVPWAIAQAAHVGLPQPYEGSKSTTQWPEQRVLPAGHLPPMGGVGIGMSLEPPSPAPPSSVAEPESAPPWPPSKRLEPEPPQPIARSPKKA